MGRHRLKHFCRSEAATATLEFCIVFPIVIILFIAVFETAMILIRQVMLERSLDNAVRMLRVTNNPAVQVSEVRDNICANTVVLPNCQEDLVIDLRVVDQVEYALPADDTLCVDTDGVINPANEFNTGRTGGPEQQLMLIRVCARVERMIPVSGFGLNLTRDNEDKMHMTAASVFVNEPSI